MFNVWATFDNVPAPYALQEFIYNNFKSLWTVWMQHRSPTHVCRMTGTRDLIVQSFVVRRRKQDGPIVAQHQLMETVVPRSRNHPVKRRKVSAERIEPTHHRFAKVSI
jgi:hypothetical protein